MVGTVSPGGPAASAVGEGEEEAGQFDGRLNRYEESIGPWCPPWEGCAWAADEAGGFTLHGARRVRDAPRRHVSEEVPFSWCPPCERCTGQSTSRHALHGMDAPSSAGQGIPAGDDSPSGWRSTPGGGGHPARPPLWERGREGVGMGENAGRR